MHEMGHKRITVSGVPIIYLLWASHNGQCLTTWRHPNINYVSTMDFEQFDTFWFLVNHYIFCLSGDKRQCLTTWPHPMLVVDK